MDAEPSSCIADMLTTTDVSIAVLVHLPADALCRTSCVCRSLREVVVSHEAMLWRRLLQEPHLAPYAPQGAASVETFRATEEVRRSWHEAHGTHHFIHFDTYVRALRVNAAAKTLVVGLHSGHTHIYCWNDDHVFNTPKEFIGRHEAQVVSVATAPPLPALLPADCTLSTPRHRRTLIPTACA